MTKFNITFLFTLLLGGAMLQAQGTFFSEDFDGGLPSDWMAVEVVGNGMEGSNWQYTTTGPARLYTGLPGPIESTTASNGWMLFDSDINCSGAQDAYLITPAIDGSDKNVVFLEFESAYGTFNDEVSVLVTTDIDAPYEEWTEFILYPDIEANDTGGDANPDFISLNLSSAAAGEAVFYIAFRFHADATTTNGGNGSIGCGYHWQIDDIVVTDADPRPANDLMVNPFFAMAPNAIVPASQVGSFGFIADIENNGSTAQTGANLNVSITNDDTNTEVFSTDMAYPAFEVDQLIENIFFPESFTPVASPASYTGTYTITIDGQTDDVPENNTQTFNFEVSDTLFSKSAVPAGSIDLPDINYAWGNIYYVPNGAGYFARYMSFGYANPSVAEGESVTTFLLKWNGDLNGDGMANENEYDPAPVAFSAYTFTGNEADFEIITIPVDLDGEAIPLEDDTYYMVVASFEPSNGADLHPLVSIDDYAATQFIADSLGNGGYVGAYDPGLTHNYELRIWDIHPYVTLSISDNPNLTKTSHLLSEDNKIDIAPNPVSDELRLDLNLVTTAENLDIEIYDVMGRTIKKEQFTKVKTQSMAYDVRQWESGTYFLRVTTKEGIRTKRFVVK